MSLRTLLKRMTPEGPRSRGAVADLLRTFSVEALPKAAADVARAGLLAGTRIYIPQTPTITHREIAAAARKLKDAGYAAMPHLPARMIKDRDALRDILRMYRDEAGVDQILLIAGGTLQTAGIFESSIQVIESGLFDRAGFTRIHIAGHPEGNPVSDPAGSTQTSDRALLWKQNFANRTDAKLAIVTQFAFDARPVIDWALRLFTLGIRLPIHVGVAGPTRPTTLLKYALACGVGPSLRVLERRAIDVSKLLLPYDPMDIIEAIAAHRENNPDSLVQNIHFFAFGGVERTAKWALGLSGKTVAPALAKPGMS